ncbi:FAD/NAD(P)-binding protein [Pararhizobium qamdonense]|uniref:FAD/NAD(P)-binding protein n=1 Tax=Pararhizobium qamdonense TaxID=3031126 RepID=UPI0023E316F2|nr:FAD/NAD(P)-binding protein [Pararhizobium qamdonense]
MTLQTAPFPKSSNATGSLARIAIIGRGFTGIMNAIALLKGFDRPFHLVMFDPNPRINGGEGVSRSAKTVLNSRVRDLSVDPTIRMDFRHWLEADEEWRQEASREGVDHSFVSGETFSAYVYQRFSEALRDRTDVVVRIQPEAVSAVHRASHGGLLVVSDEGQQTHFDAVFLASGYGVSESAEEAPAVGQPQNVIVIGGGVYAVDRALKLLASSAASHITLISASGFLPQSHTNAAVGPVTSNQPLPSTLRGAFRSLREAANTADLEGSGWQGIMNGFRLRAGELWKGLTAEERRRFKRHVKPIYDSHRNRLPPAHYQRLHQAIASGAITMTKGKVERIATNGILLSTSAGLQVLAADRTVDCRIRPIDIDAPLFRSVISAGLAKRDELELGILVDRCGRAVTAPETFEGLFVMGPLGLGSLPDIDQVPEIVLQAYAATVAARQWLHDVGAAADIERVG